MNVLLTGASGFIGSHLLDELLSRGCQVTIIINSSSNLWRINSSIKKCNIIEQNLLALSKSIIEVSKFSPDTLIHAAWYGVTNDKKNDPDQLEINLSIAKNLIDVAKAIKITTIVGLGSQAEYGIHDQPIRESALTTPVTMYGIAKLTVYHYLRFMCRQNRIRFLWLRVFSVYGPKDNVSWFIPYLIRRIISNEIPNLTEGTQLWDYIYIDDLTQAIVKLLFRTNYDGIVNLGFGKSVTIKTVAKEIHKHLKSNISLNFGAIPYANDQITNLQADISKLRSLIDWSPNISIFEGIKKTIEWYKIHEYE